jgi:hypothetical protein
MLELLGILGLGGNQCVHVFGIIGVELCLDDNFGDGLESDMHSVQEKGRTLIRPFHTQIHLRTNAPLTRHQNSGLLIFA